MFSTFLLKEELQPNLSLALNICCKLTASQNLGLSEGTNFSVSDDLEAMILITFMELGLDTCVI